MTEILIFIVYLIGYIVTSLTLSKLRHRGLPQNKWYTPEYDYIGDWVHEMALASWAGLLLGLLTYYTPYMNLKDEHSHYRN